MGELASHLPFEAHHLWIVGALLLAVGEILTGGFVLLWFALGAFAAALCALLGGTLNVQLVAFGVCSLLLFAASRTIFRKVLMRGQPGRATNLDAMIGKQAEVIDAVGPGLRPGTVKVGGETWQAISAGAGLGQGSLVIIESIEGLKLRVRAADAANTGAPFAGAREAEP